MDSERLNELSGKILEGDNEPIGIILSAEKDEIMVEYAMGGISNKIFVSKYQLYLPDKKILQKKIKAILEIFPAVVGVPKSCRNNFEI